jgi:hypothetical protein
MFRNGIMTTMASFPLPSPLMKEREKVLTLPICKLLLRDTLEVIA